MELEKIISDHKEITPTQKEKPPMLTIAEGSYLQIFRVYPEVMAEIKKFKSSHCWRAMEKGRTGLKSSLTRQGAKWRLVSN